MYTLSHENIYKTNKQTVANCTGYIRDIIKYVTTIFDTEEDKIVHKAGDGSYLINNNNNNSRCICYVSARLNIALYI